MYRLIFSGYIKMKGHVRNSSSGVMEEKTTAHSVTGKFFTLSLSAFECSHCHTNWYRIFEAVAAVC